MQEQNNKFVDKLQTGDNAGAGEAFKDALRAKVADHLTHKDKILLVEFLVDVEPEPS